MSRLHEIVNEIKVIEKSLIEDDIVKSWKKKPIGSVVTRKDGKRYAKVSETGDASKDWVLETEVKTGSDNKQKAAEEYKHTPAELNKFAKNTPETALKAAISNSDDPDLRQAAHKELDRRSKEEAVQEKEDKAGKENKKQIKKGFEQWL